MNDWDPRPLPSAARCERWAEKGGVWHKEIGGERDRAFILAPVKSRDHQGSCGDMPIWRPWLNNNPAIWNATFFPATHPPIPEGWEQVGEWRQDICGGKSTAKWVGCGPDGWTFHSGDGWAIGLQALPPHVTWADVPEGITVECGLEFRTQIRLNRRRTLGYVWFGADTWYALKQGADDWTTGFISQPAAIVHLTGRRDASKG